jgi:hypothetical protein
MNKCFFYDKKQELNCDIKDGLKISERNYKRNLRNIRCGHVKRVEEYHLEENFEEY